MPFVEAVAPINELPTAIPPVNVGASEFASFALSGLFVVVASVSFVAAGIAACNCGTTMT